MEKILAIPSKTMVHARAAYRVSETASYLLRDVGAQALKRFRPVSWEGTYHLNGRKFSLVHGSDDTFIFQEIFVLDLYRPPASILRTLPARKMRVLDLGGNIGLFGLWAMIHLPEAELTAFEPDPRNAAMYREFLRANASPWTIIEAFASNRSGHVTFDARGSASSRASTNPTAMEVATIDVLPMMADMDLVKMDIEGGEWAILFDPRFVDVRPPCLVLEYHQNLAPARDVRMTAVSRLEATGYDIHEVFFHTDGVGMLWARRTGPQ